MRKWRKNDRVSFARFDCQKEWCSFLLRRKKRKTMKQRRKKEKKQRKRRRVRSMKMKNGWRREIIGGKWTEKRRSIERVKRREEAR